MGATLAGRRGLIMGVANERSIAWGIARALAGAGAELAFTYQNAGMEKRVRPLAERLGSELLLEADVGDDAVMDRAFAALGAHWGRLDFVIHALAYSDRSELSGRFIHTSRANFQTSLTISCYSLIDVARRVQPMMTGGGSIVTLTYQGSRRVTPFYNVMGVAKAALESSVRYLANDLGPENIRVNAISPGPVKTLSGSVIGAARKSFQYTEQNAPLRRNASLDAIGGTALYLVSDAGALTTGEIVTVDGGMHILGMPQPENL